MNKTQKQLLWAAAGLGGLLAARTLLRNANAFSLQGRVVLITGGSRGLGLVLARQLAQEGAKLAICARNPEELARAAEELRSSGAQVFYQVCDVTDRVQVEQLAEAVRLALGPVEVLVNNAGIVQAGPVELMEEPDFELAMKTHFWGPLYTLQAVLPQMKSRGEGRIVNIASIGGKVPVPHLAPYCASKFALVGLSETYRTELSKDNIKVTTFCPGLMRTGSARHSILKGQHRAEYAWFSLADSNPLLSSSAGHVAAEVVAALRYGTAEVITSLPAQLIALLHGLAPGLATDLMGLFDRLLPGPGGIGTATAKGYESESALSPSALTVLNEQAAERNNELFSDRGNDTLPQP